MEIAEQHLQEQRLRVAWDCLQRTLFVLPNNDGEAVRMRQILQALSAPHVLISQQRWGAVLEKEMTQVRARLRDNVEAVCLIEIPGREVDAAGKIKCEQELRAEGLQVEVIDHHFYHWVDRTHPLSSLEQLCAKINWHLDDSDLHIAVNDRSWVPGLLALGLSLPQIRAVRNFDLRAQGYRAETIAKHTDAAQLLLDTGKLHPQDGVYVLEKSKVNAAVLSQEIALRHNDGMVNIFAGRKHKLHFSGQPAVVDALRQVDYAALGYPTPYIIYGGGDGRLGKFFGLKSTHAIDPACHARLLEKIISL